MILSPLSIEQDMALSSNKPADIDEQNLRRDFMCKSRVRPYEFEPLLPSSWWTVSIAAVKGRSDEGGGDVAANDLKPSNRKKVDLRWSDDHGFWIIRVRAAFEVRRLSIINIGTWTVSL
jgi:hypothetical protein